MDHEGVVHGQIQGHVQRLNEGIPAIGISAEVRFAYAGDQMPGAGLFGGDGSEAQEQQVPSIHEGGGQFAFLLVNVDILAGQRIGSQLVQQGHVQDGLTNA
ncbi:hypothetical protein D3C75_1009390 [compost metagenome]